MRNAAIVVLMLSAAVPVFADQFAPGAARAKDPYRTLFRGQELLKKVEVAQPAVPKAKVVCGMTIIPVTPAIDPNIALEPKKQDEVRYTIRAIDPPVCNPAK